MSFYKEYQPLRIWPDWKIEWNCFFENDGSENKENLTGNLLYIVSENRNRSIELTWAPEDNPNGEFILKVINLQEEYDESTKQVHISGDWSNPYLVFTSKNQSEIVDKIEQLLFHIEKYKDERILKSRGVVNEELEELRIEFLEKGYSKEIAKKLIESNNFKLQNLLLDNTEVDKNDILFLLENGAKKGIKNKAKQKLNSKRYR